MIMIFHFVLYTRGEESTLCIPVTARHNIVATLFDCMLGSRIRRSNITSLLSSSCSSNLSQQTQSRSWQIAYALTHYSICSTQTYILVLTRGVSEQKQLSLSLSLSLSLFGSVVQESWGISWFVLSCCCCCSCNVRFVEGVAGQGQGQGVSLQRTIGLVFNAAVFYAIFHAKVDLPRDITDVENSDSSFLKAWYYMESSK